MDYLRDSAGALAFGYGHGIRDRRSLLPTADFGNHHYYAPALNGQAICLKQVNTQFLRRKLNHASEEIAAEFITAIANHLNWNRAL